jgi:hypothetical protein
MSDETSMAVTVEIEPKLYEIWKANADASKCSLADYLKQLVLCAERHELPMMELLSRSESIMQSNRMIEIYLQNTLEGVNDLVVNLSNLKENFECEFGELRDDDPMHD